MRVSKALHATIVGVVFFSMSLGLLLSLFFLYSEASRTPTPPSASAQSTKPSSNKNNASTRGAATSSSSSGNQGAGGGNAGRAKGSTPSNSAQSPKQGTASTRPEGAKGKPRRSPPSIPLLLTMLLVGLSVGLGFPYFLEWTRRNQATHGLLSSFPREPSPDDPDTISVNCLGGRSFEVPVSNETTCGDVISDLMKLLHIVHAQNEVSLFARSSNFDTPLENDMLILDVWTEYQTKSVKCEIILSFLYFVEEDFTKFELAEQDLLFEYAFEEVLRRRTPADSQMLIRLGALRAQGALGDNTDYQSIPPSLTVHPIQGSQQNAPWDSRVINASNALKKARLKNRNAKSSKKEKGGDTTTAEEEIENVLRQVHAQWSTLKGLSMHDARLEFLDMVSMWRGFYGTLFVIQQTNREHWPETLWLKVNLEGLLFFLPSKKEPLAVVPYTSISSFGASLVQTYTVFVERDAPYIFVTLQSAAITKLMKGYIGLKTTLQI